MRGGSFLRIAFRAAVLAVCVLVLASAGEGAESREAAACTAKAKRANQAALAAYRRAMPKARAAYFRKHKSPALRKRLVKRQQAKLKKLKAAAACRVASPARPGPVAPPAPPTSPPAPAPTPPAPAPPPPPATLASETTPPWLTSAIVSGASLQLGFDEPIASIHDVAVIVNGVPFAAAGVAVSGPTVTMSLAFAADGDDVVLVNARVFDAAGNETRLLSNAVTNSAAVGFAPALAKASFADDRTFDSPEFGEWPIDPRYFLSPTRVRIVLLVVDFPSRKLSFTPRQIYDAWAPVSAHWFRRASYGRFELTVDLVDRVYHLPQDPEAYGPPIANEARSNLKTILADSMQLADPDVDFSRYDAVWVANSLGYGVGQFRAWPGEGLVFDGKEITHAQFPTEMVVTHPFDLVMTNCGPCSPSHPVTAPGAAYQMMTHELGHHLGLPDLSFQPTPGFYDFSYVAGWDLMENPAGMWRGADFLAWSKQRLGWIDRQQMRGLTAPGTVEETIAPVESAGGVKLIVAQTSPTFLYAVEVRRRLGNDAGMTCDEGVLVYTVDATKRNGQGPKVVHAAQMGPDESKMKSCGLKYAAPFDLGLGEVSTFEDANVKVEVLATDGVNYRVRVTRK